MSSKILVSALASVAAIAIVTAAQDPTFEYPAAKHAGFDVPGDSLVQEGHSSERLSVSFKNATVREVLDWLKDQGINFVVTDEQVDKNSRININAVNLSAEQLMRGLANAWNGHWEKRGDLWVFHNGRNLADAVSVMPPSPEIAPSPFGGSLNGVPAPPSPNFAPRGRLSFPTPDVKVFTGPQGSDNMKFFVEPGKPMTKEQQEQWEKAWGGKQNWEEFARKWEQWAKEYEKNFREFEKNFKKDGEWKFDQKQIDEITRHAEEMAKRANDMHFAAPDAPRFYRFDDKNIREMNKKQMEELKKSLKDMNGQEFRFTTPPNSAPYILRGKDSKGTTIFGSRGNTIRVGAGGSAIRQENLKAIYDSLTPSQQEKMKRLGYINYSDLNSRQRSLLGVITDDSWTISYKTDKIDLTIKSDR